jgi:16S rRNA (cytosine967-C5)-methyltransferase
VAAIRDGRAGVQDEGSQLVAAALAAAPLDGPDGRWLDVCAGPGGKAALLGALARQRGAVLVANEVAEHRVELVREAVAALGDAVQVRLGDGRELGAAEPSSYDRVLVDVPCTGLGALRRRPESRWRRQPGDVGALARLQRELLGSALDAVRPGGLVAYVTCSPHVGETLLVVQDLLRRRDDVEQLDARPVLEAVVAPGRPTLDGSLGSGPAAQLWPHRHGTDAMFLALLRRTA